MLANQVVSHPFFSRPFDIYNSKLGSKVRKITKSDTNTRLNKVLGLWPRPCKKYGQILGSCWALNLESLVEIHYYNVVAFFVFNHLKKTKQH